MSMVAIRFVLSSLAVGEPGDENNEQVSARCRATRSGVECFAVPAPAGGR